MTKLLLGPQQNVSSECQIIKSGQERRKRKFLRRCRKTVSDGADVRCAGWLFQRLWRRRLQTVARL